MGDHCGVTNQIDFTQIVPIRENQLRLLAGRRLTNVLVLQFVAIHARTMIAAKTVCTILAARTIDAFVNVFAQMAIFVADLESSIACAFVADLK